MPTVINPAGSPVSASRCDDPFLSLRSKAAGADWISACMVLFSEARLDESRIQKASVKRKQHLIQETRERHKALIKKQRRARRKSSSLKFVGIVAGAVVGAVSAVTSLYCPVAAAGFALAGALASGSFGIASARHASSAAKAGGGALRAQERIQDASEARQQILADMEEAVHIEQRMNRRLMELAEGEGRIVDAALPEARS